MQVVFNGVVVALGMALATVAQKPSPDNVRPADEKKEAVKLDGTYTIVSGEEDGKAIPDERIKGAVVRFTGDAILGTDKDKKEFFSATYKLDSSKTPWVIDMTSKRPKEATATGLVKKDGDTLTIIYALPGGDAPKEFKTKEKQQMFVLKPQPANKEGKGLRIEPVKP
jgi:uncharacterized protein (TIGR03067 family)